MKVPRCKGTKDLMPLDMALFRRIENVFTTSCVKWGYKEVRTPTLEYLHLFTSAGTLTPEMLGRVYSFLDWDGWSGERVVLRPDGTIPIARMYAETMSESGLAKLFYVENLFAFDSTGHESRERWECGVELIGDTGISGDVELIMLALETLAKLGINDVEVRLSHAGLIRELLDEVGSAELLQKLIDGKKDAINELKSVNTDLAKKLSLIFGVNGKNKGYLDNLRAIFPTLSATFDDLSNVTQLLEAAGLNYNLQLASGLGFEYYTGTIFQLYYKGKKLGGGGRYDELIPLVGDGPTPASGFALYVGHIMQIVQPIKPADASAKRILIKPSGTDADSMKGCYGLADSLRKKDYIVELELCCRDEDGYSWIITGDKEFSLTENTTGKQQKGLSGAQVIKCLEASL
ncbi:MAG: histidine--tRNA ligase family protein [Chloroflexi bacterium]|nr:histidine--tRNA ligase family protein [Chloroflexota bacterium]MBT7081204.1 histidine--tRNA ligase family protein [Chloroflexota bacterium]MBT7290259.1 histidine--tRNA ligase family protein [Chloroflexota bacterium]